MYDVIVIGGGHAGCEAAAAAARCGAKTLLVTHKRADLGVMSCNPAIGGLGKGHLVREIDALDGLMGRVADLSGIQFRLLNRRKGPAVQGPRAQIDRVLYQKYMQEAIAAQSNLQVLEGAVHDLLIRDKTVTGVKLTDGQELRGGSVVLTTGTFLNGCIHVGTDRIPAGRRGDPPARGLSERLYACDLRMGRLKTGTPPRLDRASIDWDGLEKQPGDLTPVPFSSLTTHIPQPQIACALTHTTPQTHNLIRDNLHLSALYNGQISGIGPRYCPSIEDKITRFAARASHQIFLEPEGLETPVIYPNGLSTSLPAPCQLTFLRSIPGLENVQVFQYGYAIEYDYIDPRELTPALEVKKLKRLFLAGQINGTTGYEEAGAQGLVAGLNAARCVGGLTPFYFSRSDGYLGVMIDDLVTQGVTEPYRMFTSRAEYRILLRIDNADQRLTPIGLALGCVGAERETLFTRKTAALEAARSRLQSLALTPTQARAHGLDVNQDGVRRSAYTLLASASVSFSDLGKIWTELSDIAPEHQECLKTEALYSVYLQRQQADITALARDDSVCLPSGFAYETLPGLSNELKDKLSEVNPVTLGQAARIPGMTPAALLLLLSKAGTKRNEVTGG